MNANETATPPQINSSRKTQKSRALIVLGALVPLLAAAAVLFFFDPAQSSFYPSCAFKKLTGWSCPACGCLRATHQLVHGNIANAFRLNALYLVLLPFLAWVGIQELFGRRWTRKKSAFGWAIVIAFVLFGVLRNLPPFIAWSGQ